MTLKGIDISSHQSVATAGMDGIDFVIVKTTQGTGYVNPLADGQYQLAKSKGRLLGFYHYAGGGDPVTEANYFYTNSKNYFKEGIPFLDWEAGENAAWGNPNWCLAFVKRIHELTGVWCGIYVQASALNQVANLKDLCALWIAGYPLNNGSWNVPGFMYSTAPWSGYAIWQFDAGAGLDKNIANITAEGWKKIANPGSTPTPKPTTTTTKKPTPAPRKNLELMATSAVNGQYGNGDARKAALGKWYTGVQAIVDHRLDQVHKREACLNTLKSETLKGVYGDGDERKFLLGSYYGPVQDLINKQSAPVAPARTYTVQSGDSLSGIGAKLNEGWTSIAQKNGLKDPYVIFPGQVLKY